VTLKSKNLHFFDYAVLLMGAANSIFMVLTKNTVLMVFGAISISLVMGDIRYFWAKINHRPISKLKYLNRHIGHLMGAYIATITAFLVNVKPFGSAFWVWLLPTFILTPLIVYFIRKYAPERKIKTV